MSAAIIFRCARCRGIHSIECADPAAEIERRIRERDLHTVHECAPAMGLGGWRGGGALGVCTLLGEAERPPIEEAKE